MLISLHMPKTAGTSFRLALEERFGERVLFDYGSDKPLITSPKQESERLRLRKEVVAKWPRLKNQYDVIHGHFRADKYMVAGDKPRIATFLREPAARALSFYRHFMRNPEPNTPLAVRAREQKMDFPTFAEQPEVVNFYALFLDGVAVEEFAFIGITERYAESLALFNRMFETELAVKAANKAPDQQAVPDLPEPLFRANALVYERGLRHFDRLYKEYFPGGQ